MHTKVFLNIVSKNEAPLLSVSKANFIQSFSDSEYCSSCRKQKIEYSDLKQKLISAKISLYFKSLEAPK